MEVRYLLRRNPHQVARGFVGCQCIIAEQNRVHLDGIANDGTLPFKANASIDDAEIGRAKQVEAADQRRQVRMKRGNVGVAQEPERILKDSSHSRIRVNL